MTRRCKVWFALLGLLLANFFAFTSLSAATITVDVGATSMTPNFPADLAPGDSVLFKIGRDQVLFMNNVPMFGGATLSQGSEHLQTFNSEGEFTITTSRTPQSFCLIRVVQIENAAPTVTLTNLVLTLAVPATSNVVLQATANDEDVGGSIRRVVFLYGIGTNVAAITNVIETSTVAPYRVTWTNPEPGRYAVRARAYDNLEVFAHSPRLVLSVYTPFTNSLPAITNVSGVSNLVFRFNANTGLVYVVEVSTNLTVWESILTNVATNTVIEVLDPGLFDRTNRFYRMRLVP